MHGWRAEKKTEELLFADTAAQQAEAAEECQFPFRQVVFVDTHQSRQAEGLAIDVRGLPGGSLGRAGRVAAQKSADQATEVIERQRMGPVRLDQAGQRDVVSDYSAAA